MAFDILGNGQFLDKTYSANGRTVMNISHEDMNKTLGSHGIFPYNKMQLYGNINRYGYTNVYNDTANREFLFFTKPDLNIFDVDSDKGSTSYNTLHLNETLLNYPIFVDAFNTHKDSLTMLQSSVQCRNGNNPFMCILSNTCDSRLDLPGISAESVDSATNMYGSSIQYRSASFKSDNGYDFTLSFTDTKYLEVYMIVKMYDELIRLQKLGIVEPRDQYIWNKILPEQFSIFKIITSDDAESILYYAKLTGVSFMDVPRGDFGDPQANGFKYSLSFHAQFVEDNNPSILVELNRIVRRYCKNIPNTMDGFMKVYDSDINAVNNEWARYPYIIKANTADPRVRRDKSRYHGNYKYMLKWIK